MGQVTRRYDWRYISVYHTSTTGGGAVASGKVKLPKIYLPRFKGNPICWTAFWDSYESAVHLNSTLSDMDKFNYLWSWVETSAYEAIAGLTLSSANYGEAVEILKKRFGNRQMIISRHMEILLNLSAVSGERNVRSLRQLYNEVEANVRSLKALWVERDSYGTMLTSVLLTKLPPEIRLKSGTCEFVTASSVSSQNTHLLSLSPLPAGLLG